METHVTNYECQKKRIRDFYSEELLLFLTLYIMQSFYTLLLVASMKCPIRCASVDWNASFAWFGGLWHNAEFADQAVSKTGHTDTSL